MKASAVVEVKGDRVRRRNDWMNWPPLASASNSPHSSAMPNYDSLAARVRNVGLEEGYYSQNSMGSAIQTEVVLNSSSRQSSTVITSDGGVPGQSTVQAGSDPPCLQEA